MRTVYSKSKSLMLGNLRRRAKESSLATHLDAESFRRVMYAASWASMCDWKMLPCHADSKVPAIKNWQNDASDDPMQIMKWAQEFPDCNWGVLTGKPSRLIVLDVDGEVGMRSLRALEKRYGKLPATLMMQSGGGGLHLYFHYSTHKDIRNSVGRLGAKLDVRANGGMLIVPPSLHASGNEYALMRPAQPIADAPKWLIDLLAISENEPKQTDEEFVADKQKIYEMRPLADILLEGERNVELTSFAGALRQKGATEAQMAVLVENANLEICSPPLPQKHTRTIARSIAKYEPGGPDIAQRAFAGLDEFVDLSKEEKFLVGVARMQQIRGKHPFALPQDKIAALMGLKDGKSIGIYIKKARKRKQIKLVEKANWSMERAAYYRFFGDATAGFRSH